MVKEKQSWQRQKGESAKAYNRFQVFLKLAPEQRTLENTLQQINQNQLDEGNNKQISLSSIKTMSTKWCWFERAGLYDHHLQLQEMEEEAASFRKNNQIFKDVFIKSLEFAEELLEKLIANENDNALSTRINMFNTLMNVLDSLYRNYRLSSGRSTSISESTVDANVGIDAVIGEENIHVLSEEDLDLILSTSTEDEEFTDII